MKVVWYHWLHVQYWYNSNNVILCTAVLYIICVLPNKEVSVHSIIRLVFLLSKIDFQLVHWGSHWLNKILIILLQNFLSQKNVDFLVQFFFLYWIFFVSNFFLIFRIIICSTCVWGASQRRAVPCGGRSLFPLTTSTTSLNATSLEKRIKMASKWEIHYQIINVRTHTRVHVPVQPIVTLCIQ